MSNREAEEVIGVLKDAGFDVVLNPHTEGTCQRCGLPSDDMVMSACFPCGMLEDPDDLAGEWAWRAILDLAERGYSVEQWYKGRKKWGRLVPTASHIQRIIEVRTARVPMFVKALCLTFDDAKDDEQ